MNPETLAHARPQERSRPQKGEILKMSDSLLRCEKLLIL